MLSPSPRSLAGLLAWSVSPFLVACSGLSVSTDHDPSADFSALKRYDWLERQASATVSELDLDRAVAAVDASLQSKGYVRSAPSDFLVAVHLGKENKIDVVDWGYSYPRYGGWGGHDVSVYSYEEGSLVLDFVRAADRSLVWRGTVSGTVAKDLSPEERTARIRQAVDKLLGEFPPR